MLNYIPLGPIRKSAKCLTFWEECSESPDDWQQIIKLSTTESTNKP